MEPRIPLTPNQRLWCEAPAKLADLPYLPDVSIQLSAISYQLSAISYQLSAISLWVTG
ncbi:hypothetical protein [Moorena sp. SIO2C4]|uniref:hypothetical protein n=1 Tax=Moorena sp. SIO2C4 TaxID=2607824 RepID=UPI00031A9810|nr:hypothetical protein [Moorena sp. SIO2C4]NES42341.1 hypothetical protein [Moorena sp. SIO2C4]